MGTSIGQFIGLKIQEGNVCRKANKKKGNFLFGFNGKQSFRQSCRSLRQSLKEIGDGFIFSYSYFKKFGALLKNFKDSLRYVRKYEPVPNFLRGLVFFFNIFFYGLVDLITNQTDIVKPVHGIRYFK